MIRRFTNTGRSNVNERNDNKHDNKKTVIYNCPLICSINDVHVQVDNHCPCVCVYVCKSACVFTWWPFELNRSQGRIHSGLNLFHVSKLLILPSPRKCSVNDISLSLSRERDTYSFRNFIISLHTRKRKKEKNETLVYSKQHRIC